MLTRGLAATAAPWPELRRAYAWVHRAARLLANADGHDRLSVRRQYAALLREMRAAMPDDGPLRVGVAHFLKVTASYWPGVFHCYAVPDLPATNNDLEHYFGSARYHERRASGRRSASPSLVVRGSVRLIAAVATRQRPFSAAELCPQDHQAWRTLRQRLEQRHDARRQQRRFRRDPAAYLAALEQTSLKSLLPP